MKLTYPQYDLANLLVGLFITGFNTFNLLRHRIASMSLRALCFSIILFLPTATWASCSGQFAGGQVCANATSSQAIPGPTSSPILGIPGSVTGTLRFAGSTSGAATITAPAVAGTPTLSLPNTSGTFPSTATSPIVLDATTGVLSCPTCVTGTAGALVVGTTGVSGATAGQILYSDGTLLRAYNITGAAGSVVLSSGPTIDAPTITGHPTVEGVTSTGATGTGNFVFATSPSIAAPTITGHPTIEGVTSTGATGTGAFVFGTSPSISDLTVTGSFTATGLVTNADLANSAITIAGSSTSLGGSITASTILDSLGSAQGDVLCRGAAGWSVLAPGTAGYVLTTGGPAADCSWTSAGTGTVTSVSITAGTGITQSGSPVTTSGSITVNVDKATAANFEAGTSDKVLTADGVFTSEVAITYGTTTSLDFSTFINGDITLTGNITTMNCSNIKAGQAGTIRFIQDVSGGHTTVFCSAFKFAGGTAPTLTSTASAVDVLAYSCQTTSFCTASLVSDVK